jgi:hypothetical protein
MRLWRDAVCVEEPAFCSGRLSLYRLPAKRRCALCAVGIGAAKTCKWKPRRKN